MRHNRLVAGLLLFAALAAHLDLARLHQLTGIGDTLNAVRVFDAIEHSRMAQRALESGYADSDLQDGQESLAIMLQVTPLHAALAPEFDARLVMPALEAPKPHPDGHSFPLQGLVANLLKIDLPPPRWQTHWQPPRLQAPVPISTARTARGPPLC